VSSKLRRLSPWASGGRSTPISFLRIPGELSPDKFEAVRFGLLRGHVGSNPTFSLTVDDPGSIYSSKQSTHNQIREAVRSGVLRNWDG